MGLTPLYTSNDVKEVFDTFIEDVDVQLIQLFAYVGEEFVNLARNKKPPQSFTDRTGNLRSSIGYVVALDGEVKIGDFEGTGEGKARAKELVKEVLSDSSTGIVLIGVAGMQYASYVESRGRDVISGSVPKASKILRELRAGLKEFE